MTLVQVETPPVDYRLLSKLQANYERAKGHRGQFRTEWMRNYRVTKNRAAPNVPTAPGVRANEVFPVVDSRVSWMTDQEIEYHLTPACDPHSPYAPTQQILGDQLETVLNAIQHADGWYAEYVKMLWDAAMYGVGFVKGGWDQGLEGGYGQATCKAVSPWCLYVDPYAHDLADARYIVQVTTMTMADIERKYPDTTPQQLKEVVTTGESSKDHLPPAQAANSQPMRNYMGGILTPINAGQGATTFGQPGGAMKNLATSDAVNVYECWFKENYSEEVESADPTKGTETVICDQWRVVVWAGQEILLDELAENLFHANRHPYFRYVDVETGEFWGDPLLRDLAPCQMAMNTLLAMGQNNIVFTGNAMLARTKGVGDDRATPRIAPGQIFDVNATPGGGKPNDPRWIQPPQLPNAVMEFIGFWRDEMERIAGLTASQRGEVPSGRATDGQVKAGQEAGFVRIRSAQRNLELTLGDFGAFVAQIIILNYDTPRFVAIVGEEGAQTSIRLAAQHFYGPTMDQKGKVTFAPMRFSLMVNAGSSKPTSRGARIQEANLLHSMGVVDNQFVAEAYRVSHYQAVQARKQAEIQQQMQLAQMQIAAGQKPGGPRQSTKAPK